MTPADQIRINALLLEREGCFLRVHELEQAAAAILGEPYPFVQPPLPSNRTKKAKRKGKTSAGQTSGSPRLRKLEDGEAAYRVTYVEGGERRREVYPGADALQTLLAAQGARLTVERVETIDSSGEVRATLHEQG